MAVLSGGNIDPLLLLRVLRHGLAAAGRYLSLRLRIPDRPGALAELLGELAEAGRERARRRARADRPAAARSTRSRCALQLETRGAEHCASVLDRLRAAGLPARLADRRTAP